MAIKNVTMTFDEELLKKARKQAESLGISLNAWLRRAAEEKIGTSDDTWIKEWVHRIEALPTPEGTPWKWNREEIYEERLGR